MRVCLKHVGKIMINHWTKQYVLTEFYHEKLEEHPEKAKLLTLGRRPIVSHSPLSLLVISPLPSFLLASLACFSGWLLRLPLNETDSSKASLAIPGEATWYFLSEMVPEAYWPILTYINVRKPINIIYRRILSILLIIIYIYIYMIIYVYQIYYRL